jgi:hypothetical protein
MAAHSCLRTGGHPSNLARSIQADDGASDYWAVVTDAVLNARQI